MNPTIDDIRSAAIGLKGLSVRTPLLENPFVNERIGGRLLVKAEPLQRTGSFKFRGAYNTISNYAQAGDLSAVVAPIPRATTPRASPRRRRCSAFPP